MEHMEVVEEGARTAVMEGKAITVRMEERVAMEAMAAPEVATGVEEVMGAKYVYSLTEEEIHR